MELRSLEALFHALNASQVRYLVVGGLAVIAHGHLRITADVDLILDLSNEAEVRKALDALKSLGFRPRAPVAIEGFGDARQREAWVREKGMLVFSILSADHPSMEVDLFAQMPLDFESAYANAVWLDVAPGLQASFVDLESLIVLKQLAAPPLDLDDIRRLRIIQEERHGPDTDK